MGGVGVEVGVTVGAGSGVAVVGTAVPLGPGVPVEVCGAAGAVAPADVLLTEVVPIESLLLTEPEEACDEAKALDDVKGARVIETAPCCCASA